MSDDTAHLDEGVALCHSHSIPASYHSIHQTLQARGVGGLVRGWGAGLKGEILREASPAHMHVIFFQLTIDYLSIHSSAKQRQQQPLQ